MKSLKKNIKINGITVKATANCNAMCYHCRDRQKLYENEIESELNLNTAKIIFEKFSSPHLEKISISGGEPTLARKLPKLISLANKYCPNVSLNTNGWNSNYTFWEQLIESGLNHVNISIDGTDPGMHNWLRNHRSLYSKCIETLKTFRILRESHPEFNYSIVSIVSNFNLLTLDRLLKLALDNDVLRWVIHYPEADEESLFSPSEKKQENFRTQIIQKMIRLLKTRIVDQDLLRDAQSKIEKIYPSDFGKKTVVSEGIYESFESCTILKTFLLLKYDGTILACNGGEYSNQAVIGKVSSSGSINLNTELWDTISEEGIKYCRFCPVPYTTRIYLRKK